MSTTIENGVVELDFQNDKFEKNVSATMQTLDGLKKALDFSDMKSSLGNIEKSVSNVDFSAMSKGVESLQDRFSALGIIGKRVLENLTDKAIQIGSKLYNSTIGLIIEGGKQRALNLEQANFKLKGFLKNDKKVEYVMNAVNEAVTGTAYALDEAAGIAAQLAVSGIEATESGGDMLKILKGIAGAAAMTGDDFQTMGNIFTKLATQQRVMGGDITQMAQHNLPVAEVLAKYWNQVLNGEVEATDEMIYNLSALSEGATVTAADIKEMASDGKISFDIFATAMSEAFGDQAQKANETYSGSLDNVKSALKRVGAIFQDDYIPVMTKIFNGLMPVINKFKADLIPFSDEVGNAMRKIGDAIYNGLRGFYYLDMQRPIINSFVNIFHALLAVLTPIGRAFKNVVFKGHSWQGVVLMISQAMEKFTEKLIINEKTMKALEKVFTVFFRFLKGFVKVIGGAFWIISHVAQALYWLFNVIRTGVTRLIEFVKNTKTFTNIFNSALKLFDLVKSKADNVSKVFSVLADLVKGKLTNAFVSIQDQIPNALSKLEAIPGVIGPFIATLISNASKQWPRIISSMVDALETLFSSVNQNASKVATALKNLFGGIVKFVSEFDFGVFSRFADGVLGAITDVLGVVSSYVNPIGNALFDIIVGAFGVVERRAPELVHAFSSMMKSVILAGFNELLNDAKSIVGKFMDVFGKMFSNIGAYAAGGTSEVDEGAFNILSVFQTLKDKLSPIIGALKKFFQPFLDWLEEFVEYSSLLDFINVASIVYIAKQFKKLVEAVGGGFSAFNGSVSGFFNSIKDLNKGITNALNGLTTALQDSQRKLDWKQIMAIALALGVFAGAAYLLSTLEVEKAATSIGIMSAALVEVMVALKSLAKTKMKEAEVGQQVLLLIGIAVAISMLAGTLKKLADIDYSKAWPALLALPVLLFTLSRAVQRIVKSSKGLESVMDSGKMFMVAIQIIAVAVAVRILASAMVAIKDLEVGQIAKGLATIVVILIALSKFIQKTNKETNLNGSAAVLLAFALALLGIYAAIRLIGTLETGVLLQGLKVVGAIMVGLIIFLNLLRGVNMRGAATTLIGLALALNLLVLPIYLLGRMDPKQLAQGLISLAKVMGMLAVAVLIMQHANIHGAALALLALAFAVTLLTIPVIALSKFATGSGIVGVIGLIMSLALAVSMLAGVASLIDPHSALSLLAMSAAVIAMALAVNLLIPPLLVLSKLSFGTILKAVAGMFAVLVALGLAAAIVGAMSPLIALAAVSLLLFGAALALLGLGLGKIVSGLIALAAIGEAVALTISAMIITLSAGLGVALINIARAIGTAIGELLGSLGDSVHKNRYAIKALCIDLIDILAESIDEAAEKIIEVVFNVIFKVLEELLDKAAALVDKLISILIIIIDGITARVPELGDSIAALVGAIYKSFEDHGVQPPSIAALLGSVIGIGVLIRALHGLPLTAGLEAGLQLAEFMVVLTGIITALGALNKIPGFSEIIAGGVDIFAQLFEAIGRAIGAIIGGFTDQVTSYLPKIGMYLWVFATYAEKFFDVMSDIDGPRLATAVKNVAEAIATLTRSSMSGGIAGLMNGGADIAKAGQKLVEFAPYMKSFASEMSGVDAGVVSSSANAALALANLSDALNHKDIFSAFGDDTNLEEFGSQIKKFGECLKTYSDTMEGFTISDGFRNSIEAAQLLVDLKGALGDSAGWLDDIFGGADLGEFGKQIKDFGDGLISYSNSLADFKLTKNFKDSVLAAGYLVDLNEQLNGSTSMWEDLFGAADLSKFGTQLELFGQSLAKYCEAVSDVKNIDTIEKTANIAATIINALAGVESAGIVAGSKLPELGENLTAFAPGLKTFAQEIAGMVFDTVQAAADAMATIITALAGKEIPTGQNLTLLGAQLENVGPMLASFANAVDGVAFASANSAVNTASKWADFLQDLDGITIGSVQSFREAINTMKTVDMSGLEAAFSQSADSIKSTITTLFTSLKTKFTNQYGTFRTFGTTLMKKFKEGILGMKTEVQNAVSTVVEGATGGTSGIKNSFWLVGRHGAEGFVNGLKSMELETWKAGRQIMKWAIDAAKVEGGVESPSKVMRGVGGYFGEGFILGLGDNEQNIAAAGKEVAEFALNAIATTMALAEDNGDFTPTITPVLDLTNVQNGISSMNSMMTGRSYSLAASTGMIMTPGSNLLSGINARNAASENSDILQSLGALRAEVASLHGDVANMQVVMDSGALVGSIAPRMDAQLGKMAVYKGRGN